MHRTNLSSIVMNMRQNATQIIYIYYLLKMDSIAIVQILSPSIKHDCTEGSHSTAVSIKCTLAC